MFDAFHALFPSSPARPALVPAPLAPTPDLAAIRDDRGTHSWDELLDRAAQGARRLAERHRPGERVGLLVPPGAGWVAALLSIWRAGCVAVPLSERHPPRLRAALVRDAGAAHVVTDADALTAPTTATSSASPSPPDPDALALLLYTSGTTGQPKGAMLSHGNLAAGVVALVDAWELGGRRALLHALPLHHMHGIAIALLPCLAAGMTCVMLPRFEPEEVWTRLGDVDTFMGVPTMYGRLLASYDAADDATRSRRRDVAASLGLCTSGSAALPQTLASRWEAIAGAIPLERWGMTEVGVGLSNPLSPSARRRGWVGRAIGGIATRIADDGELWVRGPSVCRGYWQRPEDTHAAFADDGWFRTGDVVEQDRGMFRIVGRRSVDIIKSAGFKIGALHIEECLRDHPAVDDVAVVGVADEDLGERVVAAIVLRAGEAPHPDALATWMRARLAGYEVPRELRFVAELPRNAVGKVEKEKVREWFTDP